MELEQLDENERLVLAAAIEFALLADGRITAGESEALESVVAALGQAQYDAACSRVDDVVPDLDAFERQLPSVTREEAREVIYGTVLELTLAGSTGVPEEPVLELMAKAWGLKVEVPAAPEEMAGEEEEPDPERPTRRT